MESKSCIVARDDFSSIGPVKAVSLLSKVKLPSRVYVSIDLDVGAVTALRGVRDIYPPDNGLSSIELQRAVSAMSRLFKRRGFEVVGFDVMETDVNRAAVSGDRTYEVAIDSIRRLLK
jgi:arginase family enzyme